MLKINDVRIARGFGEDDYNILKFYVPSNDDESVGIHKIPIENYKEVIKYLGALIESGKIDGIAGQIIIDLMQNSYKLGYETGKEEQE